MRRHRSWKTLFGTPEYTADRAIESLSGFPVDSVLWVSQTPSKAGFIHSVPQRARVLLGRSYAAVVLDLHVFFNPNILGQVHGFVWGGGVLIIRCAEPPKLPEEQQDRLKIYGLAADSVSGRFYRRFLKVLSRHTSPPTVEWTDAFAQVEGSREQAQLVSTLLKRHSDSSPSCTVLTADRGRGKSAALGLFAAALGPQNARSDSLRVTQMQWKRFFDTVTP